MFKFNESKMNNIAFYIASKVGSDPALIVSVYKEADADHLNRYARPLNGGHYVTVKDFCEPIPLEFAKFVKSGSLSKNTDINYFSKSDFQCIDDAISSVTDPVDAVKESLENLKNKNIKNYEFEKLIDDPYVFEYLKDINGSKIIC